MTIYDLVQAPEIASYWETLTQDRPPYMFESRFPDDKKLGLNLDYIKGYAGLPVTLSVSAFDVQAVPRNRIGFEKMTAEMPFFKESFTVDEKLRQELNIVLQTGNQVLIDAIMNRVFDDIVQLLEGAAVTRERMRALAVTTGTVILANNGQEYNYDYGVPTSHKFTQPLFNTPDFDVCAYINSLLDIVEGDSGVRPTVGILSRNSLNKLLNNNLIKKNIYVLTNGVGTVNSSNLISYIAEQTGVTFVVNSKRYKDNDGTTHQFVEDDLISIIPDTILGTTWFGTTPEESDLMTGAAANVSVVDTGVAITTSKRVDPVNVETKVSMICLPSFEAADQIIIIDTAAAEEDDDDDNNSNNGGT